jgi:DNA polymerase III delta prime subunit
MSSAAANTSSDKAQAESDSSQTAKETSKASETGQAAGGSETPEDKKKTKEYWQGKFKSARAELADAKERQQLAEDELNLLQIQDAREVDSTMKAELAEKIKTKEDEVSDWRAATEEAQRILEDLQNKFNDSGAPDEWGVAEIETSE